MLEPQEVLQSDDVSRTLGTSLNSVWNRYAADTAPSDASVEVETGVVRWSVPESSAAELKEEIANGVDDGGRGRTMTSFKFDTAAVVAKAMHRKVEARFSKKIKDGVATEVFVLETIPRKN
jgi:hypothetical protein